MSSGGGSSGQTTTQTVQKADPWAGQQWFLSDSYNKALNALAATPHTAPQGQLVARPNQVQQNANQSAQTSGAEMTRFGSGIRNYGDRLLETAVNEPYLNTRADAADSSMLTSLGGNRLDVRNNEYLMPALMGNIEQGSQKIRDITLPALSSSAGAQGGPSAYGGTRHQQMENQIVGDFQRNASDAIAQATLGAYNTERGIEAGQEQQRFGASAARNTQAEQLNQSRANFLAQLAPQITQQGTATEMQGLGLMGAAGAEQQGWAQDQLNENLQRYYMNVDAPWQGLKNYAAIIGGAIPGNTAGTNISTVPRQSAISGMAGGALGGAAMGGALGSLTGFGGPLGMGMGAILGGLGGYF